MLQARVGRGLLRCNMPAALGFGPERRSCSTSTHRPLLEGFTVLELASVLAGPSVSQFLAELGANVIKVENTTTRGDVTRTWRLATDKPATDVTAYFSSCNLGKRSVALNIKDPRGLKAVHRLAASADVVVASYKPGDAEKLKVDYATLSKINPRLIYGQITGYGLEDDRPGYDAVIQAEAGFQYAVTMHPVWPSVAISPCIAASTDPTPFYVVQIYEWRPRLAAHQDACRTHGLACSAPAQGGLARELVAA